MHVKDIRNIRNSLEWIYVEVSHGNGLRYVPTWEDTKFEGGTAARFQNIIFRALFF